MQPFHQCSSVKESFGTASLHINASKQPYRLTVWWTLEMGTLLASVRLKGLKIPSLVCKSEVFRRCFFDAFLEDIESWRPLLVKRWQMLQKSGSTLVSELLFRTEKVTKRLRGYQGFHPWSTLDSNKDKYYISLEDMSRLCLGSMWYSQSLTTKQNGTVANTKLLQPVWCCGLDEWRGLAEFVPWLQKSLRWGFSIHSLWGSWIQGSNLQIRWPISPGLLVFKSLTWT